LKERILFVTTIITLALSFSSFQYASAKTPPDKLILIDFRKEVQLTVDHENLVKPIWDRFHSPMTERLGSLEDYKHLLEGLTKYSLQFIWSNNQGSMPPMHYYVSKEFPDNPAKKGFVVYPSNEPIYVAKVDRVFNEFVHQAYQSAITTAEGSPSIDARVENYEVNIGDNVFVAVEVKDIEKIEGREVMLTITDPFGEDASVEATTDYRGIATYNFKADIYGEWKIGASLKDRQYVYDTTSAFVTPRGIPDSMKKSMGKMTLIAEKEVYSRGECIRVMGVVPAILEAGKPIAIQLIDPINTAQEWKLTVPNIRGVYAADFKLGNDTIVGEYTVTANYFGAVANDTFKLVPGILFENSPVEVKSSLTNGCVLSTELDHSNKSLKVSLLTNSVNNGELQITLPRYVIDAKVNDQEEDFITMVDGKEIDFRETSNNSITRTLVIPTSADTQEIEIMGTQVIPEFPVGLLILAAGITSIIFLNKVKRRIPTWAISS
jgi:hypothetical protein